jgi:hypothetical protein
MNTLALLTMLMVVDADVDDKMYKLIARERVATLSTDYKGFPFGSLTPFVLDKNGNPVVFLSDLAQHTENIDKNSKASIMIYRADKKDLFNSARITFVGKMVKLNDKEREEIKKVYLKRHPEAESFIDFGDFNFYRLEVQDIHYIGGFGDINWVEIENYRKNLPKKRGE